MTAEITNRQLEIIEAAGKILTESGINSLTTKNLAQKVGFSESALYRHFSGKEEIVLTMLTYLAKTMGERLELVHSENQTPEEQFITLFQSQFSFFSQNPHFVVAVFSDGLMEENQKINDAIFKIMSVKMKYLMPIIMEGQQKKVFTNALTTDELTHIVMGTFRLQMYKWRVANFQFDIIRNGDNMIQSILTLIKDK